MENKVKTKKKSTQKNTKKTTTKKVIQKRKTKKRKNNKKGITSKAFTLIELLAVIIILAVLMIIAIPSVTTYISDSRKKAYVDTAKEAISGARTLVNSGKLNIFDEEVSYYIPIKCIPSENGFKSPYGEFEENGAYVGVIFDGNGYKYYWISNDVSGQGINIVTSFDDLDSEKIVSGIKKGDVNNKIKETGIDGRNNIIVFNNNCKGIEGKYIASPSESEVTYNPIECSNSITETIYWALQDNNSDGKYEKLIISDSYVSGGKSGNFPGNKVFSSQAEVPWNTNRNSSWINDIKNNLSCYVSNIVVEGNVSPKSTAFWFYGIGAYATSINFNLSNLDTCNVTSMKAMFAGAGQIYTTSINLDVSHFNTANVIDMSKAFAINPQKCSSLRVDLSNLDTRNVEDMSEMLYGFADYANSYYLGDISRWNTSHVTNMKGMFWNAFRFRDITSGINLDLSHWDTSRVTDMSSMFACFGLSTTKSVRLNLSNWNTSRVTTMNSMFNYYGKNASSWSLEGLSNWNTSNVTDMYRIFESSANQANKVELDISGWNTSKVTRSEAYDNLSYYTFSGFGQSATTWIVKIPKTNGNGLANTTSIMYGSSEASTMKAPTGKYFTLSN